MSVSPTLDPESPYYLHPDFEPEDKVILSVAEDNYFIWKRDALVSLGIRNKTGFVDGTVARPDPSSPLYDAWEQCNEMVTCWLLSSVDKAVKLYVFFAETADKAWLDIGRVFATSPRLKIYELRQRIALLTQDGDSLACYFGKLNLAWEELSEYDPVPECACGGCRCEISKRVKAAREKEKVFGFLIGSNNDPSIANSLVYALNADWKIHQLRLRVAMPWQSGCSLADYFRRLDLAWEELSQYDPLPECACGACRCDAAQRLKEARENEKLFGFVMGLDAELDSLAARIRLMNPPPSLKQAYSLLLNWTS